jgi:hypothetical protein
MVAGMSLLANLDSPTKLNTENDKLDNGLGRSHRGTESIGL